MTALTVPTVGVLEVPDLAPDVDTLTAALAYARAGWYVGPLDPRTKNPGSVLLKGWHRQTSRDPQMITSWFAGRDDGVFLHAGRSGAVIFDVDYPDKLHPDIQRAIDELKPPMHGSRPADPGRGHYVFASPPDRTLSTGLGSLANGWGELRGGNSVIVAFPTPHSEGGEYRWRRIGAVPMLPAYLAEQIPDAAEAVDAATDTQVTAFLHRYDATERVEPLQVHAASFTKKIKAGESRHLTMVGALTGAMKEAAAGLYPARLAANTLESLYLPAVAQPGHGKQGHALDPRTAANHWSGLLSWAVAQANAADPEVTRARTAEKVPSLTAVPGPSGPTRTRRPSSKLDKGVADVDNPHRGQVRIAYRLAEAHHHRLLYVHGLGWHAWDGARWAEDDGGAARRAVLDVLRSAVLEAFDEKDNDLRGDVARCESAAGIDGVLTIASALKAFAATVRDLDTDPYLLNLANGTLDLRTMTLREHDPGDRITKVARAAWRPETTSTAWADFIASVLPDEDVRGFLQRLVGVALLGKVVEHILAIETGTGANGKGTAYKAQLWALGDYASTAEPDLFMARDGAHPTGEMDLRGRRLVVVSESDKDRRLAEATMKRLTGGDPIKARRMRADFVEFEPSHTALLVTNHLPKVTGDDPAIWRRVRVIPFDVTFTSEQQDTTLDDRLRLDSDAVLAWCVDGYRQYDREGLAEPEAVRVATERYQLDSDALSRFLEERCLTGEHYRCPAGQLFEAWSHWCSAEGVDPGSKKAFGLSLDRKGYPDGRTSSGRLRKGIALLAEDSDDDG